MARLTGILGVCALLFAIIDWVHGPHNGDTHRVDIHAIEFISFFGFLCLLESWAFKAIVKSFNLNRWLVIICLSLSTCILSMTLFGISGGSFHGDGGPIAFSLLLLCTIGSMVLPVSLVGFVVVAILRKRGGVPILDK
jgi:hypothetical protein